MSTYSDDYAARNRAANKKYFDKMTPEERSAFFKTRYQKNKERYRERSKQWAKNNPTYSQAAAHQSSVKKKYPEIFAESNITTPELKVWLDYNRDTPCSYCGLPGTHIDHILPLARGGKHQWENICLACKTCNLMKTDHTLEEWKEHIRLLMKTFALRN